MELRQLRFFVTLSEELHFRRAAVRMHITQPAFSEQIRRLESELGVQLFDRTSHYVRLTMAGRLILDEAQRALAQVDHVAEIAAQARRGELGSVTVGFGGAANELMPLVLRRFADRHPTIRVALRGFGLDDPSAGLAGGDADVAFMRPPVDRQHELELVPLLLEPRVAVMASDHPLAGAPAVTLAALLAEPFVVGPRSAGAQRDHWLATEHRDGVPPRLGPEAATVEEWLELLAAGSGVSLAPASSARLHARPALSFVPVLGVSGSTVAIAHRRAQISPAARAFVAVARHVAGSHVPLRVVPAIA